jgi:two-component system, LytTR family, sensor kinase
MTIAILLSWLLQTPWLQGPPRAKLDDFALIFMLLAAVGWSPTPVQLTAQPWLRWLSAGGRGATTAYIVLRIIDLANWSRFVGAPAPLLIPVGTWTLVDLFASPRVITWLLLGGGVFTHERRSSGLEISVVRESALRREAQDAALRARLAPHFIFNTLATLKAQIDSDPKEASATTDRLAALFRQVLALADRPTVPLREELGFVEAYLGIERARLGKRLRVKVEVPEEVEGVEIPPLSLQALVENAVKHGVAPREEGGEIIVAAGWNGPGSGRKLLVSVTSPTSPAGNTPAASTGTGLATLRGRLAHSADFTTSTSGGRFKAEFLWGGATA